MYKCVVEFLPAYSDKTQFQKVWLRLKENYSSWRADTMKKRIFRKTKGHNSKMPDAISLIIELGLRIVVRSNFRKFGEY